MNRKELSEIRRRWKSDRSSVANIYGCYVNSAKEIIASFDSSLGLLTHEESEMYLSILKKTLSGTLGRNLIDIEFDTQQVVGSEEHGLLMALKKELLHNAEEREELCRRIIASLSFEDEHNYLILMAADAYDVPHRRDRHEDPDSFDSGDVFKYFLCCICPVKPAEPELGYRPESGDFRFCSTGQTLSAPELGFMFPSFDGRTTNIYNALYYTRNPAMLHQELIDALFRIDPPMSAPSQKETFGSVITEVLEKECRFDVVQSVNEQIRNRILLHDEAKLPENLELSIDEVGDMLRDSGVDEDKVNTFKDKCSSSFGENAVLNPNNIIDAKKLQIDTPEIRITLSPENACLIDTRIIDGKKFILIPADGGVEINGINVRI